ncbi:UDP-2,3-diacylglucosamine diphosphatase [Spongiivirga sp. MCCC 1A20706]|uniref:UDP-2,3-diacylglucosamine diphosphatase n=1 Tax=Spongiivirga sp. MCCC 1A20706 TaxID=3160963 RepID=UPI003977D5AE
MKKRKLELVVLSDIHLGTYGCHAEEVLSYLNSIKPKKLILNGDIIDIWQFRKWYFPKSHLLVLKKIIDLSIKGTEVIYITGNHDEMLRKFANLTIGNISITNKLVFDLDGKKTWVFHGDVFDASIQHSKWIAKLGGWGYDILIVLNKIINWFLLRIGREKYSLSKRIKNSVKKAIKFISDFEQTVVNLAIEQGYKTVICGHIHQPRLVNKVNENGYCMYLNSGDWVENLSALEYKNKRWKLYYYHEDKVQPFYADQELKDMDYKELLAAITITSKPS